jgi:hypothetical protein
VSPAEPEERSTSAKNLKQRRFRLTKWERLAPAPGAHGGGVITSVGRVSDRDLLQVEGVTGGGEPLSAAAAFGAAASAGTASAQKFGQALLDCGEPVVRWLVRLPADRETGNSAELAPSGRKAYWRWRSRRRRHPGAG